MKRCIDCIFCVNRHYSKGYCEEYKYICSNGFKNIANDGRALLIKKSEAARFNNCRHYHYFTEAGYRRRMKAREEKWKN